MKFEQYQPSPALRPFIRTFRITESDGDMENTILPDTSAVMAFRLKGNTAFAQEGDLPAALITGLKKTPRLVSYGRSSAMLLVLFHEEAGASAFFDVPIHHFFESSVALQDIMPHALISEVEEKLVRAADNPQRIAIIEAFLCSRMREHTIDRLVIRAIRNIRDSGGTVRIKTLAEDLNISLDPFEKRFRRIVGATPKQFSAIVRFRSLLDSYDDTESLTEAAYRIGYFDQAHFIKDFRSFTGHSPTTFFETITRW